MNKKVLTCLIVVFLVVVCAFIAINSNSKKNNEQANNTVTDNEDTVTNTEDTKDTEDNNAKDDNSNDSNSTSQNENTSDTNNSNNNTGNTSNSNVSNNTANIDNDNDIDAAAKADIAKSKDDAVKKLLDYYLGAEDAYIQNTVKITLITNADNTITARKTDGDSNIYYSSISPLSDSSSDGLIISIDNYNETDKTYSYSLKNYADVKSGNTNNVLDSGTIPEEGNVTSNPKNK